MRKKIRSRLGATVLEMLTALIILSLLTAGGVAATSAVMADYTHMTEASNAEILASTIFEAVSNEIRLGQVQDVGDNLVLKKSTLFGENVTITLEDGRLVAQTKNAAGVVTKTKQVLSESAYDGLKLTVLTFEKNEPPTGSTGRTVYKITLTVSSEHGGELWSGSVSVAPMFE